MYQTEPIQVTKPTHSQTLLTNQLSQPNSQIRSLYPLRDSESGEARVLSVPLNILQEMLYHRHRNDVALKSRQRQGTRQMLLKRVGEEAKLTPSNLTVDAGDI